MSSTPISFNNKYYEYHSGEKEEQGLTKGGYESASNMVLSYLFVKPKALLKPTTYHVIYRYDILVVFKVKKSIK